MYQKKTKSILTIRYTGTLNLVMLANQNIADFHFQNHQCHTCILEPFSAEDIENENEGKQSWSCIHNYLENYGLGTDVTVIQ